MADTPRAHRFQIPLHTRSTDVQQLTQCEGRWVLQLLRESEQAPASFLMLGQQLHETIEVAINTDLDEDWALRHFNAGIDRAMERVADASRIVESSSRTVDSMRDDGTAMLRNWYRFTHPDSPKRLEAYNDYDWPPQTEVEFYRTDPGLRYPVWGSIDAVFTRRGVTKHHAIVDWKSSVSKQRDSHQMDFYRFGYGLGGTPAWYHNIARVQARSVIQEADPYPGDDAVRARIRRAERTKDRILEKRIVNFKNGPLCNYCPVQHICPLEGDDRAEAYGILTRALKMARPTTELPQKEVA